MASSFPNLGRAPSLPSRIVTVDLAETHIGQPETGAKVDFTLPQDIHVRADGVIVQAGTVTLELDATGRGEIRLPCYSSASKPEDWVILVKKHWAPYSYPIRVPAGNTKISLASLEPPVEVSDAMSKFVPTDAVVRSIKEGAQWAASAEVDGGIINLDFTVPPGGEAYYKGGTPLTGEEDLGALTPGVYTATNIAVATQLGLPRARPATIEIITVGSSGARTIKVQTIEAGEAPSRLFVRDRISGVWSSWEEIQVGLTYRGLLSSDTDLNDVRTSGVYGVSNLLPNRPEDAYGTLEVIQVGTGVTHEYTTLTAIPRVYRRRGQSDGSHWFDWVRMDVGAISAPANPAGPVRRDLLQQALTARKGGRIGTGNKGAIALRFDDAPAEFIEKVLPLLQARGLPFTRVTTSDSVASTGEAISDIQLTAIQDYCISSGGEVWNHGRTHANVTGEAAIYDEVIGSLEQLRQYMPRIPVDCFAPPGGSNISYDGHMPSTTISNFSDTYAGQLLTAHHSIVSGYLPDTYYRPLDGILRDGQIHYSCDAYTVAKAKQLIDRARDWRVGVVMMWHAHNLDTDGDMTTAQLAEVLDYLVAQRDAGGIAVLTVSGLACADISSTHRDDLLATHTGATGLDESIIYPQYRQGILGSTRELTATVTGTPGGTVTSVVCESTKTHVIPADGALRLHHPATIPTDITSLPVSITGGAVTDAHLYAI